MLISRRTFLARTWTVTWVSAILSLLPSSLAKAQTLPKHLKDALELLSGLRPENNKYQHNPITVTWKGFNGVSDYISEADCSGFMSKLLSHSYGFEPERFKQWMRKKDRKRPLAEDFHYAIVNQIDFTQIKKITQIQPGDIIAVEYARDNDPKTRDNTGHVMLVAEYPKEKKPSSKPFVKKTIQWEVAVIDQSCSGHGKHDSRRKLNSSDDDCQPDDDRQADDEQEQDSPCKPNKRFNSGLGSGVMRLYTNEEEDIVGYTWSTLKNSEYYCPEEKHLVVGRFKL